MKTIKRTITTLIFFISLMSFAKSWHPTNDVLYMARKYGAKVSTDIVVLDQDGLAVDGAKIYGALETGRGYNDYIPIDGYTDQNGMFHIEGKCINDLVLQISKDNYYNSKYRYSYSYTAANPKVKDGKWQPYGTKHIVKLNKMLNPQKLCCSGGLKEVKFPVYNEWLGFDCERYDFVAPHGNGVNSDMMMRFVNKCESPFKFFLSLDISFTNSLYAGAYKMSKDKISELKSVYNADTNAVYQKNLYYMIEEKSSDKPTITQKLAKDEYLVFRTRTKVDEKGNLISAHYGKIYGELSLGKNGDVRIDFFAFNPIPNDTNLEDSYTSDAIIAQRRHDKKKLTKRKKKSSR